MTLRGHFPNPPQCTCMYLMPFVPELVPFILVEVTLRGLVDDFVVLPEWPLDDPPSVLVGLIDDGSGDGGHGQNEVIIVGWSASFGGFDLWITESFLNEDSFKMFNVINFTHHQLIKDTFHFNELNSTEIIQFFESIPIKILNSLISTLKFNTNFVLNI